MHTGAPRDLLAHVYVEFGKEKFSGCTSVHLCAEVYTGSALAGFIQKIHNKKIGMCQFCIHYFNNIRVRTQKSHITTLSRLQEVAIKKQISNFAKNTTVSDMQFLRPNLFVIK